MLVKLLGSFGPGHVLSHEGRDFTFARIDQGMKAALSVAYFKRAREAVYVIKGEVDAGDYDRQLTHVLDGWRRGQYGLFPGSEAFAYFLSSAGLAELVTHLTRCKEAEAQKLLEERAVEVLHLCLCLVYDCLGDHDKKKLLDGETTPAGRVLVEMLQSRTATSNGSPCSKPTKPQDSPVSVSTPISSPG